jgi:hypothetical protein
MEAWTGSISTWKAPDISRSAGTAPAISGSALVRGEMDCRMENTTGKARIEFSWEGSDEMDPCAGGDGHGSNRRTAREDLLHMGDDSRSGP